MSTLRVDTIQNAAGTDSPISVPGTAKAWVNFNGTGTVAIRASYNVSSITDNGTGDYTVNFTTAMPDTNFCPVAVMTGDNDFATLGASRITYPISSTSSCPIRNYRVSDNIAVDQIAVCVAIFR